MLNILLLILKITGIVLLILIGIVFLLVFMILFIPVRYRGNAQKSAGSQMPEYAGAKAGWLLNMITACYEFKEGNTALTIRVLGIRLKSREEKELKKRQRREKKKKNAKDVSYSMLEYDEESDSIREKDVNLKGKTHVFVDEHEDDSDITEISGDEAMSEHINPKSEKSESEKPANAPKENDADVMGGDVQDIYEKIRTIYEKISSRIDKTIDRLRYSAKRLLNILTGINESLTYYHNALFNDARNREVIGLLIRETKRILKAITPRRIRGHLRYGSDDPSDTGKFLAGAAMLYPFYHGKISIVPDFDDKILEFDLILKGRIYICTLVSVLLKLYFNKKVKRFIHIMKKENANG